MVSVSPWHGFWASSPSFGKKALMPALRKAKAMVPLKAMSLLALSTSFKVSTPDLASQPGAFKACATKKLLDFKASTISVAQSLVSLSHVSATSSNVELEDSEWLGSGIGAAFTVPFLQRSRSSFCTFVMLGCLLSQTSSFLESSQASALALHSPSSGVSVQFTWQRLSQVLGQEAEWVQQSHEKHQEDLSTHGWSSSSTSTIEATISVCSLSCTCKSTSLSHSLLWLAQANARDATAKVHIDATWYRSVV